MQNIDLLPLVSLAVLLVFFAVHELVVKKVRYKTGRTDAVSFFGVGKTVKNLKSIRGGHFDCQELLPLLLLAGMDDIGKRKKYFHCFVS